MTVQNPSFLFPLNIPPSYEKRDLHRKLKERSSWMRLDGESDLSPQYRLALTLTGDKSLSKLVDAGKTRPFYLLQSGSGKVVRKQKNLLSRRGSIALQKFLL